MAAFRFFDPVPQFTDALGNLCAGGSLTFTDSGTTTPRPIYSDDTLGTSLGSTLTLDSDARYSEDPYLSGEYRVVLKDADGVTVWTRDNVRDVASGGLLPPDAADGSDGQALFTDGTENGWYFGDVLTIPSQTGNQGKYLGTDGESLQWTAFAEADTPTAVDSTASSSGSITVGDVMIQWGSDTAPSAGAISTSKAVTFGTAFSGNAYTVQVTPTATGVTSDSPSASCSAQATSLGSTGFTANFFAGAENEGGNTDITSSVPFTWLAVGPV